MEYEIEENDDNTRHVIYVTGDDANTDSKIEWSHEATTDLLKLYDEKMDLLETGIITTRKKMWEIIGKDMNERNYEFTGFQCENKWKSLKRAYNHRMRNANKVFKKALPFEKEVAEILSKHNHYDHMELMYNQILEKNEVDNKFFSINLNEPPGPNDDDSDNEERLENNSNLLTGMVELRGEIKIQSQRNKRNIELQEKSVQVQEKICKYLEVLQERVDQNVNHIQMHQKSNEVQERMCKLLEILQYKMEVDSQIEEKNILQQNEIIQQMKTQKMLLNKLMEKQLQQSS